MKSKKSDKVNLDKKKKVFFYTGMVISLSLILLIFEWQPKSLNNNNLGDLSMYEIEDEIIPITRPEVKPPPPPPPKVTTQIEIVDDKTEIKKEIEVATTDISENAKIDIIDPIDDDTVEYDPVFKFAAIEEKPEFNGGVAGLLKYIASNTKYPQIAKENGIGGKVYVQFVIDKTGKVTEVSIARGKDPYLDKEALRVVQSLPKWKPGKQRGKPVKVSYVIPINFKLK